MEKVEFVKVYDSQKILQGNQETAQLDSDNNNEMNVGSGTRGADDGNECMDTEYWRCICQVYCITEELPEGSEQGY